MPQYNTLPTSYFLPHNINTWEEHSFRELCIAMFRLRMILPVKTLSFQSLLRLSRQRHSHLPDDKNQHFQYILLHRILDNHHSNPPHPFAPGLSFSFYLPLLISPFPSFHSHTSLIMQALLSPHPMYKMYQEQ